MEIDVSVCDGKYRVVMDDTYNKVMALRYDQPWRDCTGDNLVYYLAAELDEARDKIKDLERIIEVL